MQNAYRPIRVALLGAGSVGSQVARLLLEQKAELASRVGAELELVGIAVRDLKSKRNADLPVDLLTTDAEQLILSADIVIELIGGIEPARTWVKLALNSGADVITANKALIAAHGPELFDLAQKLGAQLYFEAAVGGAIPIIRPLRESLAGDKVNKVMGIVNGTTNFILDRMESTGADFNDALTEAQALGYAEADPTADVEAFDAASKAAILSSLAFHSEVPVDKVYREGITKITAQQIEDANSAGYTVKLLAICERVNCCSSTPNPDSFDSPVGCSARCLQCSVRRSRVSRAADVLRSRCGWTANRISGFGRLSFCGKATLSWWTRSCRFHSRQPATTPS